MFSHDFMRYIIDNKDCQKPYQSSVLIKNSNKDYHHNLKNEIKNIKLTTNSGLSGYMKLLKKFQKNNINF